MTRAAHILVIEDEPAIREGLLDVLVFHGFSVESAETGPDGLRKAQTGKFDLILLDITLPGMDGYEICDRIRAEDRMQPIIMLTAKTSDEEIVQGLKLGADDYVSKPFSVQQLVLPRAFQPALNQPILQLPCRCLSCITVTHHIAPVSATADMVSP